ncbi:MFS general substrate transporter [Hymenopellis radicata]|nr:MFS general substrate transporter [Hymenopellis radicata]
MEEQGQQQQAVSAFEFLESRTESGTSRTQVSVDFNRRHGTHSLRQLVSPIRAGNEIDAGTQEDDKDPFTIFQDLSYGATPPVCPTVPYLTTPHSGAAPDVHSTSPPSSAMFAARFLLESEVQMFTIESSLLCVPMQVNLATCQLDVCLNDDDDETHLDLVIFNTSSSVLFALQGHRRCGAIPSLNHPELPRPTEHRRRQTRKPGTRPQPHRRAIPNMHQSALCRIHSDASSVHNHRRENQSPGRVHLRRDGTRGVISAATGAVHNFSGLVVCRFFLGFVEAVFFLGALHYLSTFYNRNQYTTRVALLYSGSQLGNTFGGLFPIAILKADSKHGLEGWRWLFIIEGAATVGLALIFMKWIAWNFELDQGQKDHKEELTGMQAFVLAVTDPKTWLLMATLYMTYIAAAVVSFFPSVVFAFPWTLTSLAGFPTLYFYSSMAGCYPGWISLAPPRLGAFNGFNYDRNSKQEAITRQVSSFLSSDTILVICMQLGGIIWLRGTTRIAGRHALDLGRLMFTLKMAFNLKPGSAPVPFATG